MQRTSLGKVLLRPSEATAADVLRVLAGVFVALGVVIALLIPVQACGSFFGVRCSTSSLWAHLSAGDLSEPGLNFRWPLRVGVLGAGVIGGLVILAFAQRGKR